MKKKNIYIVVVAGLVLVLALSGLGIIIARNNHHETANNKENNISNNTSGKNVAVIYFSATGTTESVAKDISEIVDADLIEIVPKQKYKEKDLTYDNDSRAVLEQDNPSSRPKIKNNINIDNYDVIYLGYPIWFGDVPHIILTFIDSHNLDGKTIVTFCTSGSSSITDSMNTLKKYNKKVNWIEGQRLTTNREDTEEWLKGINY